MTVNPGASKKAENNDEGGIHVTGSDRGTGNFLIMELVRALVALARHDFLQHRGS